MSISESNKSGIKVNPNYTGHRLFYVPVKMYVQNKLLSAVGIKTKRWLRVDLDRQTLAFHHCLTDVTAGEEISFSQIKSMDADFSKGKDEIYYLTITGVDDSEYKFKFQNIREFYEVVNALRNTLREDQTSLLGTEEFSLNIEKRKEALAKPLPQYGNVKHIEIQSDDEFNHYEPAQKVTTYGHTEGGSKPVHCHEKTALSLRRKPRSGRRKLASTRNFTNLRQRRQN